jgi:hypothetical protein
MPYTGGPLTDELVINAAAGSVKSFRGRNPQGFMAW